MTPTRPISSIQVGERHRRDLGDVDQLAASIAELGLLHPVVIKPDGALIAGERRLEACRALGWADVPVTVVDLADIVRGDLPKTHIEKISCHPKSTPSGERLSRSKRRRPNSACTLGKISTGSATGKTRDKIGAIAGISGRQVEKIAEVVEAAEKEPQQFGHLMEIIDSPHGVSKAYYALRRDAISNGF